MRNKLRLLTAALLTLYCSTAFSLGMGELELRSHLNQRFDAEIVLTGVGDLEIEEILPNLASQEDFDRVGVDRNYLLVDLRFKVRVREDGNHVVHITSNRPIIEPFLNFIVEVIWPTGRILREYTVLLDPPVFGSDGVEKIEPGTSSRPQQTTSSSSPRSTPQRQAPVSSSVNTGRDQGVATRDGEYGMTGPGDTLWTIALKVRPNSNVSVQQTMLAIQRANPDAFINNNINLLKAGHVLRVPDLDEIREQTTQEAIAEVKFQNEEYEDYRAGGVTQMDARRTTRRQDRETSRREDGELKLLASDETGARSGRSDGRADELQSALTVAREDLDRSRRANSEMQVRLDDLQGQIETLNEIVKLKDDQLAALRAELQKMQNTGATTTPAATSTATTPQQSGSLLTNPMVLGGLGVVLVGGIVAAMLMLRRRRQAAEMDEDEFQPVLMDDEPQLQAADDSAEETGEFQAAGDEEEDVTQQTSDVIGEAEIYIAYGRFPQAISFLQNAIEAEPDRADIQLKLLEVYVQTEDATAFNLQFEQLRMLGDADATARAEEMQAQIPGAAENAAAAMDATVVSSEPIQAIADPDDDGDLDDLDDLDDDDLSFDLDDLDSETEDDALDLSAADDDSNELSLDEAMELGDADLDLDLDAALDDLAEDNSDEEELDLDLDDGLDLDMDDGLDTGEDELDLGEDLDLSDQLDLDDDGDDLSSTLELDSGVEEDDNAATVELDDTDLDLGDLGDLGDLEDDDGALDLSDLEDDDDALDLGSLEDDDALDLGDLEDDDGALDLSDLEDDDDALDLGDLDDDGALDLSDMADDDDALNLEDLDVGSLEDDGEIELDLGDDDDGIELDLGDDDFDLGDLDDDDLGELNLDEDASSKLDLARAYIEMGDSDGAKSLLEEVVSEGDSELVSEANELLAKIG